MRKIVIIKFLLSHIFFYLHFHKDAVQKAKNISSIYLFVDAHDHLVHCSEDGHLALVLLRTLVKYCLRRGFLEDFQSTMDLKLLAFEVAVKR
mgnify:CR=1 FL=1